MKKKSKIRILKDNQKSYDSYTFVTDDIDNFSTKNSEVFPRNNEFEENTEATNVDDLNKIYKKKKTLTNEDMVKSSKGLKFSKPSQRNHSSVYE